MAILRTFIIFNTPSSPPPPPLLLPRKIFSTRHFSFYRLYYVRADVLRDKQVALKNSNKKNDDKIHEEMKVDNESDTDSDDIDDMFDWRAKKA